MIRGVTRENGKNKGSRKKKTGTVKSTCGLLHPKEV
nr:MAG TPA: hypothetical protein [Inoviridae sp.]